MDIAYKHLNSWQVFILAFLAAVIYSYSVNKYDDNRRKIITSMLLIIQFFLIYLLKLNFINVIFIVANTGLIIYDEKKNMSFSTYQHLLKMNMLLLGTVGIFAALLVEDSDIVRLYILYIIISLILMRSMRRSHYNISEKKSKKVDSIIVIIALILSNDVIASKLIKVIFKFVSLAGDFLIMLIKLLVAPAFIAISRIFKIRSLNMPRSLKDITVLQPVTVNNDDKSMFPSYLFGEIIKWLIIAALLFAIYRLYHKYHKRGKESDFLQDDDIEKETITTVSNSGRGLWKRVLNYQGLKGKVLKSYQSILVAANDLGIYKASMSAEDLYNELKHNVDKNQINNVTQIYNETKFSSHDMNVDLKAYIKNAKAVRKKLKEIYKKQGGI